MSSQGHPLPPRVSTILFDVGNTLHHVDHSFLADTISTHAHAVSAEQVAVSEYAAKHAIDALFRARDGGNDTTRQLSYFETLLADLGVGESLRERIVREIHTENQRDSLWRVMVESTPSVLAELRRRGFILGVVSNADGRVAAAIEEKGTASFFKTIIDSHVVGVEKPNREIFELALAACDAKPEETLYVGDIYEIDVRGARAAHLTPILLDPLGRYGPVDCISIDSLERLLELLP